LVYVERGVNIVLNLHTYKYTFFKNEGFSLIIILPLRNVPYSYINFRQLKVTCKQRLSLGTLKYRCIRFTLLITDRFTDHYIYVFGLNFGC